MSTKRAFGFIDFEAWEWVNPIASGMVWGEPNARKQDVYINRDDPWAVIRHALSNMESQAQAHKLKRKTPQAFNHPTEWWAHNGGKYDWLYILREAQARGWGIQTYVKSGRVIRASLNPGKHCSAIHLLDSYCVAQSKLEKCAIAFELPSRKILNADDYSVDVRSWTDKRLTDGVLADCMVGMELIEKLSSLFESHGGKLKSTFSSSALTVVKARVNLPTMEGRDAINQMARRAYFGGRVEVFNHFPKYPLSEWDINSSYPWSMTQTLPWDFVKHETHSNKRTISFLHNPCVVHAQVTVPDVEFPVLPYRPESKGVYFPTGQWQGWFCHNELEYAVSIGHAKIDRVYQSIEYTASKDLSGYVHEFYKAKAASTGALREFYKLCLNGSYGKFGQKPEVETLRFFDSSDEMAQYVLDANNSTCCEFAQNWLSVRQYRPSPISHFALAGYITAYSRILLHRYMMQANGLAYVDTDSVHAKTDSKISHSQELGTMKLEIPTMVGKFYAPKIYSLTTPEKTHYACKGFPVQRAEFERLVNQEKVFIERMQLYKSQIRKFGTVERLGTTLPREAKKWSGLSAKRQPRSDGSTRPWTVQELVLGLHTTEQAASPLRRKT